MTEINKTDRKKDKQNRLAQALRDNLRRRKQQAPAPPKSKAPSSGPAGSDKE